MKSKEILTDLIPLFNDKEILEKYPDFYKKYAAKVFRVRMEIDFKRIDDFQNSLPTHPIILPKSVWQSITDFYNKEQP
jgi:hypothetical protein